MKGIRFLTNDQNKRIAVQIDLDHLEKFQGEVEDILDAIISESRKDDEEVSWKSVKNRLKSEGKIS
ncbi:MAG: hypothetical protein ABI207_05245 [Crocinitomicaceae bacterium]